MLSADIEKSLSLDVQVAQEASHEFVTTEHLLLALLDNKSAARVIKACGGNLGTLRSELVTYLEEHIKADLPQGLIHGDLYYDNVLVEGKQLKAIIDFGEACRYFLRRTGARPLDPSRYARRRLLRDERDRGPHRVLRRVG